MEEEFAVLRWNEVRQSTIQFRVEYQGIWSVINPLTRHCLNIDGHRYELYGFKGDKCELGAFGSGYILALCGPNGNAIVGQLGIDLSKSLIELAQDPHINQLVSRIC